MTKTDRMPMFSWSLGEAARWGASHSVGKPWIQRLRALLLAGRSTEAYCGQSPRLMDSLAPVARVETSSNERRISSEDGATKIAVGLKDGSVVETVVLPSPRGVSVCLSTQVGCPVGCRFCASGLDGFVRNLECHEIVEQFVHARRFHAGVDRLVVMGIGEPLLNAENLFRALDIIREEGGVGPRRMVVSTVGARHSIRRLIEYGPRVSLALSLHAPDDGLRRELIPSTRGDTIEGLLADVDAYIERTRRKALIEYVLLGGVNDSDEQAKKVGNLLRDREMYLNVIPFNPVPKSPFRTVSNEKAHHFSEVVRQNGAFATVRKTMGGAESAACGQLRADLSRRTIGGIGG